MHALQTTNVSPTSFCALHHATGGKSGEVPGAESCKSEAFLLVKLAAVLADCPAATTLYVAGPESFLWRCHTVGRDAGMTREQIQLQLAGSAARRVYCVHCRAITESVTTSVHRCSGCGQALLVRDHFSRLMECYAGVRVDAEVPGDVPEAEEIFA